MNVSREKIKNILKKLLQARCQRAVDLRMPSAKTSHELEHAPGGRSSLELNHVGSNFLTFMKEHIKGIFPLMEKISIGVPNLFNY